MKGGEYSPEPETQSPAQEEIKQDASPASDGLEKGSGSRDRLSRSKMQYEPDPEDLELRKKLLESKMARKKTEEDAKILMNRLLLLKTEEQKVAIFPACSQNEKR